MKHTMSSRKGFTLIEILVALGISSLALIMLTRLFSVSLNGYTRQEQTTDMNQNARYTIRELGEIIMQAGADLQQISLGTLDRDTIIFPDGNEAACSGFTLKINPNGGMYQIPQAITTPLCSVKVDAARRFRQATKLQRLPANSVLFPLTFHTITRIDTASNYIVFTPATTFARGDAVCSFIKKRYYKDGTNLCIDSASNIIAENIDSLCIIFQKKDGSPTARWSEMRSAKVIVRTKTALPINGYKGSSDHHQRLTLTYTFRLRNKIEF